MVDMFAGDLVSAPKRVQMSRQHPWQTEPKAIKVSRPGKWGNPFKLGGIDGRAGAIKAFRWLLGNEAARVRYPYPSIDEVRAELAGKDLACWCPLDLECHADVLLDLANGVTS